MGSYRIEFFLHDRLNDYQSLMQSEAEQVARRYDLILSSHSANRDSDTQSRQIRAAIDGPVKMQPAALIVSAVREIALVPLMSEAVSRGIAWVFLSRSVDGMLDLRRRFPAVAAFAVLPDQSEIGRVQGRQLEALMRSDDELVYIQGPSGTFSTKRRHQGTSRELSSRPSLLWSPMHSNWSQEGGEETMRGWLGTFARRKVPNFIVAAQNDAMAMGARQALLDFAAAGGDVDATRVHFVGCDGTPAYGRPLVESGQLTATVAVPSVAGTAIEELHKYLLTKRVPPAEITLSVDSYPPIDQLKAKILTQRMAAARSARPS